GPGTATQARRTVPAGDAPAPPARRPGHPVLIAALGDSITAGAPLWDPNPRVRARAPDELNEQSQYEYWARRRLGPNARFRNGGAAAAARIAQLNRRIAAIGRDQRVPVLLFHDAVADPAHRDRMRGDLTVDGNHPDVAGYRLLGNTVNLP